MEVSEVEVAKIATATLSTIIQDQMKNHLETSAVGCAYFKMLEYNCTVRYGGAIPHLTVRSDGSRRQTVPTQTVWRYKTPI